MPDSPKIEIPRFLGKAHTIWSNHENEPYNYWKLWALSMANAPRESTVEVKRLQWLEVFKNKTAPESWVANIDNLSDDDRVQFCKVVFDVIDPLLASYFGSEYMPLFLRFYANKPDDDRPYAASWHCDAGPRKHLKLLLYLNDSDESGGNTEFLNYDTTMRLDEIGYLFCGLDVRKDDLSALCKQYGIPYTPISQPIQAGHGVLFEPACVMHRAIWPTRGTRYMAQICILPSPIPWYAACEQFGMPFRDQTWRNFNFGDASVE